MKAARWRKKTVSTNTLDPLIEFGPESELSVYGIAGKLGENLVHRFQNEIK
jgi:hypothetical protein